MRSFANRNDSPPAVVVGIGTFGGEVLAALELAAGTRPALSTVSTVWIGPEQWQSEVSTDEPWPDPTDWWQEPGDASPMAHRAAVHLTVGAESDAASSAVQPGEAVDVLQEGVLAALRSTVGEPETVDCYLIAHLQEPAGRILWRPILAAVHAANRSFDSHTVTCFFATDSPAFHRCEAEEAAAVLEAVEALAQALEGADEDPSISWCYLVDSLDIHRRPLTARTASQAAEERRLSQAHLIAEFIVLAQAGLRRTPAYRRTARAALRRAFRPDASTAWISTFTVGSYCFPATAIAEQARDRVVQTLVSDYLIGKPRPTDRPIAWELRDRWRSAVPLAPAALRHRLLRDRTGSRLDFPTEPPQVRDVPDEWLVDHLENWDTILWNRWHRPDGPPARLAEHRQQMSEDVISALEHRVDQLLRTEIGGTRIAAHFLKEVERMAETERAKLDPLGVPAAEEDSWLTALLAPLRPPPSDPTTLPDLARSRARLEQAVQGRLNRRAVWVRAGLFAVTLLSFAWAAYDVLGRAIGIRSLVVSLLDLAPTWSVAAATGLDLLVLPLLCLAPIVLASWLQLYRSDRAIRQATDRMIADIRRKYDALLERALRDERAQFHADLQAALARLGKTVAARRALLAEVQHHVEEALARHVDPAPLRTEEALVLRETWSAYTADLPDTDRWYRELAERCLYQSGMDLQNVETPAELVDVLRAMVTDELAEWRRALLSDFWKEWAEQASPEGVHRVWMPLRPALPLDRSHRAALITQVDSTTTPAAASSPRTSLLVSNFMGLPAPVQRSGFDLPDLNASSPVPVRAQVERFHLGTPERLAWVSTLHGLHVRRLSLWTPLRTKPSRSPSSNDETERDAA